MGAGAVGSYYGACLARAGHEVTLVARGAHLDALATSGTVTVRETAGPDWTVPVMAAATPPSGPWDLVLVTTKSQDTAAAARALAPVAGGRAIVVSLQNGVENGARIRAGLPDTIFLGGLVFVGLQITTPGSVDHHGEGRVTIGDGDGTAGDAPERVAALVGDAWELSVSDDIVRAQWTKLLWNVGFNTICAITQATAGEALATPETADLITAAANEAAAVAAARGVAIPPDDVARILAYRPALRTFLPSTAQDIAAGKEPERDILAAFVMREGRRLGVPTPVNDTLDALLALQADRATGRTASASLFGATGA